MIAPEFTKGINDGGFMQKKTAWKLAGLISLATLSYPAFLKGESPRKKRHSRSKGKDRTRIAA
jgi:hypothetical protein